MVVLFLSAHAFVCTAARPVPVATALIAVGIPVMRLRVILNDLSRDLVQYLAPGLLILLDLFALTSSAIGHETSLVREPKPICSKECATHSAVTRIARSSALRVPSLGFDTVLFVAPPLLGANRSDEHHVDRDEDEEQDTEVQEDREHVARVYPRMPTADAHAPAVFRPARACLPYGLL